MTAPMGADEEIGPIVVQVSNWPASKRPDDIASSGFSISTAAANERGVLLPQDVMRYRAVITTDNVVYVGTKAGIVSDSSFDITNRNHQAARLPAGIYTLYGKSELWYASSGAINIGVLIERLVTD